MLAGLRLGPGLRIRKLQLLEFPGLSVLQGYLSELFTAQSGARFDLSWPVGNERYVLSLSQGQSASLADWKLYRCSGQESKLMWEHQTNDVTLVCNLVLSETGAENKCEPADRKLSTIHGALLSPEAAISTYVTCPPTTVGLPLDLSPQPVLDSIDLSPTRQLLERLSVHDLGILSNPAFIFFFEQEYYNAIDSGSPITVILFKIESGQLGQSYLSKRLALNQCLRQIKSVHRKTDVFAEYDDNRFAFLLADTDAQGARLFAQKIERSLLRNALITGGTNPFFKITFGIAALQDRLMTPQSLLQASEQALLQAENSQQDNRRFAESMSRKCAPTQILGFDQSPQLLMHLKKTPHGVYSYPAFLLLLQRECHRATRHRQNLFVLQLKIAADEIARSGSAVRTSSVDRSKLLEVIAGIRRNGDALTINHDGTLNILRRGASAGCLKHLADSLARRFGAEQPLISSDRPGAPRLLARVCAVEKTQSSPDFVRLVATH